jgi:hypothetical protein
LPKQTGNHSVSGSAEEPSFIVTRLKIKRHHANALGVACCHCQSTHRDWALFPFALGMDAAQLYASGVSAD